MPSYKSVTEQAGIYAGKEGFDIKVENNTDLKGAVISSKAEADKNTLTTGTISFSDIKNEAEYDTKGIGMTLDANKTSGNQPSTVGQKGLIPTVPASVGDSAESTTKSGVSEGKINVTKPEKQKQDVNTLNRDTKNTLNKLDKIFDLEKIREDQETAALFGELAANGIHVLAEKNKWKNDDPEKIALHAAVGAVVASITKGNIASGALAGGATEYLANEILKACKGDKAQAQWVAMIIGAAIGGATGGNPQIGALIAFNAIKNNNDFLSEEDKEKIEEVLNNPEFQEELRRHRKDGKLPPDLVGVVVSQLNKGPEAKSVYGEIGVLPLISAGCGGAYDMYGNYYAIGGISAGFSSAVSGEACTLTIITLDEGIDLNADTVSQIMSGTSIGYTSAFGREVGVSIPIGSDYDGRVVVVKNGIATAQLSAGVSKTVDISEYLKKIREFIINNQTTQGRSIADEIVPQGS